MENEEHVIKDLSLLNDYVQTILQNFRWGYVVHKKHDTLRGRNFRESWRLLKHMERILIKYK